MASASVLDGPASNWVRSRTLIPCSAGAAADLVSRVGAVSCMMGFLQCRRGEEGMRDRRDRCTIAFSLPERKQRLRALRLGHADALPKASTEDRTRARSRVGL